MIFNYNLKKNFKSKWINYVFKLKYSYSLIKLDFVFGGSINEENNKVNSKKNYLAII